MAKNPQSKDEALEALDFIVNVLKEHEHDLDKLINELATVTEQMGDASELSGKVEKLEEKINGLQKEVANFVSCLSGGPKEAWPMAAREQATTMVASSAPVALQGGLPVVVRCKQWEDFLTLAFRAQTLSFSYSENEKIFQADALKGNQVVSYSGPLPKLSNILKLWLSKQLEVSEHSVLEGVLTLG
ncbi:MAG: hypothetical protein NWE98_01675 [Candidatus Bathyarchaeota archaeon]|nr:hypothetical protein [Candidatus Bathyarchaeota archaeon]